jgi:hypothetical protein
MSRVPSKLKRRGLRYFSFRASEVKLVVGLQDEIRAETKVSCNLKPHSALE